MLALWWFIHFKSAHFSSIARLMEAKQTLQICRLKRALIGDYPAETVTFHR